MTSMIKSERESDLVLSRYVVASETFSEDAAEGVFRMVLSTRSGKSFRMGQELWDTLLDGKLDRLSKDMSSILYDAKILTHQTRNELAEVLAENDEAIAESTELYQVIQPSAFCQLGCNYCGQKHARKQLDEENRKRIISRIESKLQAKSYTRLHIGWFGAEPLAGKASIRAITPKLEALAKRYGVDYSAHIVTNGVSLDVETARELVLKHKIIKAEITLDGPREEHDARRFFKTGGPSFERILANVQAVANDPSVPLTMTIRCNVDSRNAHGVEALVDTLVDADLAGKVNLYFAPVHDWGNSASKLSLTPEAYARCELDWAVYAMSRGFPNAIVPTRKKIVCMAVQPDSEVIDAYGNVFNCTETPYTEDYGTTNRHRIGVLHEDKVDRSVNRFGTFNSDVAAGSYGCSTCPMLPVCGGACPKSWVDGQAACPPFKHNMPDRLLVGYALNKLTASVATLDLEHSREGA